MAISSYFASFYVLCANLSSHLHYHLCAPRSNPSDYWPQWLLMPFLNNCMRPLPNHLHSMCLMKVHAAMAQIAASTSQGDATHKWGKLSRVDIGIFILTPNHTGRLGLNGISYGFWIPIFLGLVFSRKTGWKTEKTDWWTAYSELVPSQG